MYSEGAAPRPSEGCESACPGATACGVAGFLVAAVSVLIGYSLVVTTLVSVPELAAAAAVYALFFVWGVAWILLAAGYQRATRTASETGSRRDI